MASKQELKNTHEKARLDKERDRRNKNYLDFLDAVAKGEKRNYDQYRARQRYIEKRDKEQVEATKKLQTEEAKLSKLKTQQITQDKKSRSLARDYSKFLKSNTGTLLEQLKVADADNNLAAAARGFARDASDKNLAGKKEENLAAQEAYNIAQDARKESMMLIDSGDFEGVDYVTDLQARLEGVKNLKPEIFDELKAGAQEFGDSVDGLITSAGGGENFSKKLEMSKDSMTKIDGFKDKIFKVKSFLTDPKFRNMMLKGMFIGLAVKAAKALGDTLKASFDFAREMGISFKSIPVGVSLAKDEAGALLDTFGTLKDVTSENLIAMKWNAYWYGVAGTDSAKLMKLQMSITDSTKEMALDDQRKFMKELVKEGLSANKVFSDMAGHSEFIAKYMKDGGKNMEEAAKYAASMGLSLDHTEAIADSLLDFESSIAAEMQASVLLGRSINLDKARQLAYTGKIKEMQEEVKRQVGGEAEFAKMSVDQRQAMGTAIGLNAVQLAEFVKAQEGSTEEQNKGADAIAKSALLGMGLGAVLGAIAVGFGAALWGAVAWFTGGAASGAAIRGGLKGLGKGMLGGAAMGGTFGGIGGLGIGAIQQMASGGPVKAGNPYVVGDGGVPELFVPGVSGHILPNVPQMSDGTGFVQGDMSQTNSKLDKLIEVGLMRSEQADVQTRKLAGKFADGMRQG